MALDGGGASSSTSPSSSFSTAPADPQAPPSSSKEAVSLNDWWLVKSEQGYDGMRLAVGGMQMKPQQATTVFCSSPIVKRHSTFILETADGATVIVQGLINKQRTLENGFPAEATEKFLMGFPYNWEAHASLYCGQRSGTQNAPGLSSFIVGLPVPSADFAGSVVVPMRRLLDYLISSRGISNGGEFAKVHKNCGSQPLGCPTVLGLYTETENSGRNEVQTAHDGRNEDGADCSGINEDQAACRGRNEEQVACNRRNEVQAASNGRKEEQADCNGRNEVQATDSSGKANKRQAAISQIKAVQFKKVCVSKGGPSVTARGIILEDDNEGEQTQEESPYQKMKWTESIESPLSGEGHCSTVGKASRKLKKPNKSSPHNGRDEKLANSSGRNEEQADCSGKNVKQAACSGRNKEQAACNGGNEEQGVCSGRKEEQATCSGINEEQAACSPSEVNKQQAAFNQIKGVQFKKLCVSKGSPSVTARRIILEDNNEGEQTPEESVYQKRKRTESVESPFSSEGQCSIVGKASRKLKKSNKNSPLLREEMCTARYNLRNSSGRRSNCGIMKNLEEDQVTKGNLEREQKVGTSMVENNGIVDNMRSTTATTEILHGIHMDGSEDPLEKVRCAETPKSNDSTISQSGNQVDGLFTACVRNEASISSIEHGDAAVGSTFNSPISVHQSIDGVKGSAGKRKKGTLVTQHRLMRSSVKKGVVLPESLSSKRTRSGRLIVPVLADWCNQQPVYDLDGGITGIAIGLNKKLPPKG